MFLFSFISSKSPMCTDCNGNLRWIFLFFSQFKKEKISVRLGFESHSTVFCCLPLPCETLQFAKCWDSIVDCFVLHCKDSLHSQTTRKFSLFL